MSAVNAPLARHSPFVIEARGDLPVSVAGASSPMRRITVGSVRRRSADRGRGTSRVVQASVCQRMATWMVPACLVSVTSLIKQRSASSARRGSSSVPARRLADPGRAPGSARRSGCTSGRAGPGSLLALEPLDVGQLRVPLLFEAAGDQAMLGLDGQEAAPGQVRLVARLLQAQLPLAIDLPRGPPRSSSAASATVSSAGWSASRKLRATAASTPSPRIDWQVGPANWYGPRCNRSKGERQPRGSGRPCGAHTARRGRCPGAGQRLRGRRRAAPLGGRCGYRPGAAGWRNCSQEM